MAAFNIGLLYLFDTRPALRDPLYHERTALLQQHLANAKGSELTLIVMVGTSRTGNAFNARLMQEKLSSVSDRPVIAFNFGIAGCGPVMQQVYVRRLLKQGIKPSLIILEALPFYYLENGERPMEYEGLDLSRLSADEMQTFSRYGVSPDDYRARWNEIRLNPYGEMRFQLLRRVRPAWLPANLALNWNSNCDPWGWRSVEVESMPEEIYRKGLERSFAEHGRFFPGFRFGRPALQALNDTLALCHAEGIPVMLIHLPEDSHFRAWYPSETKQLLDDTLSKVARDHGAEWVDASAWASDGMFFDGHHILKRGAIQFTERLSDRCRTRLEPGRTSISVEPVGQ